MVLFVAEHDFIVGSETDTVGFFHVFLAKKENPFEIKKKTAIYFIAY